MTMPGINYYAALPIISEIVDINRFAIKWKLVSYAGSVPSRAREEASPEKAHDGSGTSWWKQPTPPGFTTNVSEHTMTG